MAEYIEQRESVLAEIENEYKNVDKIKTPFAKIIVDGTVEKPYYSILWLDKENKGYNVGYSSYCIDYVFKWLEVVFEIVAADESPAADVAPVVRCKDCKHSILPSELTQRYGKPGTLTCHNRYAPCNRRNVSGDDFCSYGDRRDDA